ncbi:hypothetical protein F7U74_00020 [Vibrio vulnificus]|nr:hypothetical protein [Vibrio vulnificus]
MRCKLRKARGARYLLNSPNKAFKSDSQRLAVSLRSSIAKRRSHLNAALAGKWNIHQKKDCLCLKNQ